MVVVDDGTTHPDELAGLAVVQEFMRRRDGWQFVSQDHAYVARARNHAASFASTKYVLFFDDDDFLRPTAVERMLAVAEFSRADIVTCWIEVCCFAKQIVRFCGLCFQP